MVLKCLVNSSQLPQATPTGHTLSQAISNLGQQQVMKPYKETSDLINFIPSGAAAVCSYQLVFLLLFFSSLH